MSDIEISPEVCAIDAKTYKGIERFYSTIEPIPGLSDILDNLWYEGQTAYEVVDTCTNYTNFGFKSATNL